MSSSRAQILFEGHPVAVYKHHGGYPDGEGGVLEALLPCCQNFARHRGWDPFRLVAQVVHRLVADHHAYYDRLVSRGIQDYPDLRVIGIGVEAFDGQLHGDLDHVYVVRPDHVEIRGPGRAFWDSGRLADTKLKWRTAFDGSTYQMTRARQADARKRRALDPTAFALTDTGRPRRPKPSVESRRLDL